MVGAAMSGITFVSVPGSVAADSFSYLQMVLGFTVGQMVIAFVLIPLFYRLKVVSLYEYLDGRFGMTTHLTGAWFFFISKMFAAALKVYVVCTVLQVLVFDPFGVPFAVNAAFLVGLVWLYTWRGGVRSVVWTDILHTCCLVGSIVLCIVFIMRSLGLTSAGVVQAVCDSPMSRIFFFEDAGSARLFLENVFRRCLHAGRYDRFGSGYEQRNLSCRSPWDSQINIVITAFSQMAVILLFLVLGVLLYLYAEHAGLPMPEKGDQLFAVVAVNAGLPLAVGIMFVVGLISSTYSSAGAAMTALTTSFTVDILRGPKRWGEGRLTQVRIGVHVVMALVMGCVVLFFGRFGNDSVINLIFKVAGYTYGPILGMFAFGICTRRRIRDRWVPLVAFAAPLLSVALQSFVAYKYDYHIGFELIAYNALFTVIGMSLLVERRPKPASDN